MPSFAVYRCQTMRLKVYGSNTTYEVGPEVMENNGLSGSGFKLVRHTGPISPISTVAHFSEADRRKLEMPENTAGIAWCCPLTG